MEKMNSGLFGVVLDTVNAAASFNGRDDKGLPGALRVSHRICYIGSCAARLHGDTWQPK